jgi:hypothetical protein
MADQLLLKDPKSLFLKDRPSLVSLSWAVWQEKIKI